MRRSTRFVSLMTTVVGAALLGPLEARGDEAGSAVPRQALAEHVFIPRVAVHDPFTTSFISSTSGFADGSGNGPTFDLDGKPVNIADYKIVAYQQAFTGQWGVLDWLALRLQATGTVYTGANASGVAGVGVNGVIRANVGATMSWELSPRIRLGFLLDVGFGPSVGLNILQSIRQSIADGSVQTPVETTSSTIVTPTISSAWTLTRGLGLIANAAYSHNSVAVEAETAGVDALGVEAALDLDLRELGSIPLGLSLSYNAAYSIGYQRFRLYVLSGGIFYTGRRELTVGIELGYRRAPLGTEQIFVSSVYGLFVLRYSFN